MRCAWPETTGKVPCCEGIRNVSAREKPYAEVDGTELDQPGPKSVCAIPGPLGNPVRVGWRNQLNSGHRILAIHMFGKQVFLGRGNVTGGVPTNCKHCGVYQHLTAAILV